MSLISSLPGGLSTPVEIAPVLTQETMFLMRSFGWLKGEHGMPRWSRAAAVVRGAFPDAE
jgi:hypothetical protein